MLKLVLERSRVHCAPIQDLARIADHASEWGTAHSAFSVLRESTLKLERWGTWTKRQKLRLCHLYLAENVAKVIYNAIDPPNEFDEDSGWWVVSCLKDILDLLNDNEFSQVAWSTACFADD